MTKKTRENDAANNAAAIEPAPHFSDQCPQATICDEAGVIAALAPHIRKLRKWEYCGQPLFTDIRVACDEMNGERFVVLFCTYHARPAMDALRAYKTRLAWNDPFQAISLQVLPDLPLEAFSDPHTPSHTPAQVRSTRPLFPFDRI